MRKKTTAEFVAEYIAKYGDEKYGLDHIDYVNSKTPVKVWCKKHQKFFMIGAAIFLAGHGCRECGVESSAALRSKTNDNFIQDSKKRYGDTIDFSRMKFVDNDTKVELRCIIHDLIYYQSPKMHVNSNGCIKCGLQRAREKNCLTQEEFIRKSKLEHGISIYIIKLFMLTVDIKLL